MQAPCESDLKLLKS